MRAIMACASLVGLLLGSGCAGQTTQCLQMPPNGQLSDAALSQCGSALERDMDNKALFQHYMEILRVQGRHGDIIAWSNRILEHDGNRIDAVYHLAVGLRKDKQFDDAIAAYRAYSLKNPDDADPYFGMALCFEELGDRLAAIQAYETYLKKETRESQAQWVEQARQRIEELGGDSGVARAPVPAEPAPTEPAPAEPVPAEPAPAEPAPAEPVPAPPAPVSVEPTPAEPTPEPRVVAPPAPPRSAPAPARPVAEKPKAAAPVGDCQVHVKAVEADPFDLASYERYAECGLARKQYQDVIKRLKTALRDNPKFLKAWLYLGQSYRGLGDGEQAAFAFGRACDAGVQEACGQK